MEIKHQPIITKAKVFLQPGNRMMFELEQFSQRGNMTRDSDQNPIDTEESVINKKLDSFNQITFYTI